MITATIELPLRTREVYHLFERRISGDRLFIDAILHKVNIVVNRYRQQEPSALVIYQQMEQSLKGLTQAFTEDITRFEALLAKKKDFAGKSISVAVKYHPTMCINNPLALLIFEFIEMYDKLVVTLKLLHLTGCFDSDEGYLKNIGRYQKMSNQMLSGLLLKPVLSKFNSNVYLPD